MIEQGNAVGSMNSALEEVFLSRRTELVRFAYTFTRNAADAQDLVQEALFRVLRMKDIRIEQLHAYLYKAIANIAVDGVRKRITRQRAMESMACSELDERSPERILIAEENLATLARVIEGLPHKTRVALVMLRLEGAAYEDIAAVFGIRVHSARRLVERANEYLRPYNLESAA